jgi:hypothetical protein
MRGNHWRLLPAAVYYFYMNSQVCRQAAGNSAGLCHMLLKVRNACQRIIAWGGRATVLGPGRQVRQIAEARAEGLVLLVNAQWQGGQAISDFGVGPWRRRTEAFVASFVEVYSLRQFRIFGDNVRRARGPVRVATGAKPASERRGVFACVVLSSNMRRLSVISQGVASMKKARCVRVWQLPLTSSGCKERACQWGKSWIAGLSWYGAGLMASSVCAHHQGIFHIPPKAALSRTGCSRRTRTTGRSGSRARAASPSASRRRRAARLGRGACAESFHRTCICSGRRAVVEPQFQEVG